MTSAYVFCIIYAIIDIIYLNLSKNAYFPVIAKIQNKQVNVRMLGFILAYVSMIIGWYFLVSKHINNNDDYKNTLLLGLMYGIAVYGTFNFTLYAIFDDWNFKILMRDLLWGCICSTILTYTYAKFK